MVENKSEGHDTRIDTFISYHIITYYRFTAPEALHTLKHTHLTQHNITHTYYIETLQTTRNIYTTHNNE